MNKKNTQDNNEPSICFNCHNCHVDNEISLPMLRSIIEDIDSNQVYDTYMKRFKVKPMTSEEAEKVIEHGKYYLQALRRNNE